MHICIYIHIYVYIYTYICKHVYKYAHIYTYIYMYIYVNMYMQRDQNERGARAGAEGVRKFPVDIEHVSLNAAVLQRVAVCCSVLQCSVQ